jgi:hypothetical protein
VPFDDNAETFAIQSKYKMQMADLQCDMDKINTFQHIHLLGILYSLPADSFHCSMTTHGK